ncbi:hypothetical protein PUN28_003108 [Cardiocondyla obscurior]|uniref:Uncharacterized protein n=1 Tax=Cardiocondyla obscurior TaxID=286306 RepID=A0AAW2GL48_9HYME
MGRLIRVVQRHFHVLRPRPLSAAGSFPSHYSRLQHFAAACRSLLSFPRCPINPLAPRSSSISIFPSTSTCMHLVPSCAICASHRHVTLSSRIFYFLLNAISLIIRN